MEYGVEANMTWIEEAAEEHLDSMQAYGTRRDSYEKALIAVADIAGTDEVSELADWVIEKIETYGFSPEASRVRQAGRYICGKNGYDIPETSYLVKSG